MKKTPKTFAVSLTANNLVELNFIKDIINKHGNLGPIHKWSNGEYWISGNNLPEPIANLLLFGNRNQKQIS